MAQVHEVGRGIQMTGYTADEAEAAKRAAVARGDTFCMPRKANIEAVERGHREVACPHCGEICLRPDEIPDDAKVACTECALRRRTRA